MFTGDGANDGLMIEREEFVTDLAELPVPVYVVTGNHDYDNKGIDGHLMMVGPELDMTWSYGELRFIGLSSGQDLDDGGHAGTISESSGPDDSQLTWLAHTLEAPPAPTVFFLHHPIYNGLFATVGPESRDRLKALVTRDDALAVLAGHTHITSAYDADGNSRDLSLDAQNVDPHRLPLHYTAARATNGCGGYAVFHLAAHHVDYRWVSLPVILRGAARGHARASPTASATRASPAGTTTSPISSCASRSRSTRRSRSTPASPRTRSHRARPARRRARAARVRWPRGCTCAAMSRWSARRTSARTTI